MSSNTEIQEPIFPAKKPNWLRVKLPIGEEYKHVRNLVDTHKLHTICESGNCPNILRRKNLVIIIYLDNCPP